MKSKNGKWAFWEREEIKDEDGSVYLKRIRIFETPWLRLFLHDILRSDGDRDLHDHPWWFISLILRNGYIEKVKKVKWLNGSRYVLPSYVVTHQFYSFVGHLPETLHRIELYTNDEGEELPARTLILAGRKTRQWGFQTESGWIHNNLYNSHKGRMV